MADHPDYAGFNRLRGDETHNPLGTLAILLPGEGTATYSRQLHIIQAGDRELDLNVAAQAHPTLYLHSTTTPITDYLRLGGHDGSTCFIDNVGGTITAFQIDGTTRLAMSATSLAFDGGGLTVDQAALDTNILSLRSSDVSHGMTTIPLGIGDVADDDFFTISKHVAGTGGAMMQALAESSVGSTLYIDAWGGTPSTTDTSTDVGVINIFGGEHDGANADTDMAADSNLIAIGEIDASNVRQTRFLLKADDGELHLGDSTLVALDAEDDIMLVRALQRESANNGGIIDTVYDASSSYNHSKLMDLGIAGPKDETGFYLFALQPRMHLHEGAMWQLFNDLMGVAEALPDYAKRKLPPRIQNRLGILET